MHFMSSASLGYLLCGVCFCWVPSSLKHHSCIGIAEVGFKLSVIHIS